MSAPAHRSQRPTAPERGPVRPVPSHQPRRPSLHSLHRPKCPVPRCPCFDPRTRSCRTCSCPSAPVAELERCREKPEPSPRNVSLPQPRARLCSACPCSPAPATGLALLCGGERHRPQCQLALATKPSEARSVRARCPLRPAVTAVSLQPPRPPAPNVRVLRPTRAALAAPRARAVAPSAPSAAPVHRPAAAHSQPGCLALEGERPSQPDGRRVSRAVPWRDRATGNAGREG